MCRRLQEFRVSWLTDTNNSFIFRQSIGVYRGVKVWAIHFQVCIGIEITFLGLYRPIKPKPIPNHFSAKHRGVSGCQSMGDTFSAVYRFWNTFLGLYRPIQPKPILSLHFRPITQKIGKSNGTIGFGLGVTKQDDSLSLPSARDFLKSYDHVASLTWGPPTKRGLFYNV